MRSLEKRYAVRLTALTIAGSLLICLAAGCAEETRELFETGVPAFTTTVSETTESTSCQPTVSTDDSETTSERPAFTTTEAAPATELSETTYPPATIPVGGTVESDPVIRDLSLSDISDDAMASLITQKYLTINEDSRPGYKLRAVQNIVVHYVGNPGSTAANNWLYFERVNGVSAHFIIGLDGEILQCMPLDEVAWAIGTRDGNYTSISIECCHPDETGQFTDATYRSLVKLVSWLCRKFCLGRDDVLRHYDYVRAGGWQKPCPVYYVNHPIEWEKFKDNLLLDE